MRATEMHDLIRAAYIELSRDVWQPGQHEGFRHIQYCRYCHYSQEHGHGKGCIMERLGSVSGETAQ